MITAAQAKIKAAIEGINRYRFLIIQDLMENRAHNPQLAVKPIATIPRRKRVS